MNYPDNRKGIFVFSDAAGANSILAVIDILIADLKKPGIDFLIFSDSKGKFDSKKYDFVVKLDFEIKEVSQIIEEFHPDYIYTATSFHDYEHNWRKLAAQNNIYSYAFIDHWIFYKKRFTFDGLTIFPDEVLVVNEIAKKEAIIEGIPSAIIKVFGNPYYNKVKNYRPNQTLDSFKKNIGITNDDKVITFVSENIRDDIPKDSHGKPYVGFDEYQILENVLDTFLNLSYLKKEISKINLVIKIHPISNKDKFDKLLSRYDIEFLNTIVLKEFDSLMLCYYSDYVLGMFSNMLIEALLLDKKVHRIQINKKVDLFKFTEIESLSIDTLDDLNKQFLEIIDYDTYEKTR